MDVFEKITRLAQTIIDVASIDTDSNTQVILTCAKDIIEIANVGNAQLMNAEASTPIIKAITATSSGNSEIVTMNTAVVPSPLGENKSNAIFADPSLKEVIRKCIEEELKDHASFADPSLKEVIRKCIKEELKDHASLADPSLKEVIRKCITEELQDFNLIPPKPRPPQVSSEFKLPYTLLVEKKDPNDINIQDLWHIEYTCNKTDYRPLCERQLTTNELRIDFETFHQRRRVFREISETQTLDKKFKCVEADRIVPLVVVRRISKCFLKPAALRDLVTSKILEVVDKNNPEDATVTVESTISEKESSYYRALLAVSLRGWQALISSGELEIGNRKCSLEDYVPVEQCNNCLQYGHSGCSCTKNVTICAYCASDDHTYRTCKVKDVKEYRCCYNCETKPLVHSRFKPLVKHTATSTSCPHWELACERVRLLTNNALKPVLFRPPESEE